MRKKLIVGISVLIFFLAIVVAGIAAVAWNYMGASGVYQLLLNMMFMAIGIAIVFFLYKIANSLTSIAKNKSKNDKDIDSE